MEKIKKFVTSLLLKKEKNISNDINFEKISTRLMTKREFTGKGGEVWTWEETPETIAALEQLHKTSQTNATKRLHEDIRKLKAQDDKMNYDTSGK